MPDLSDVPRYLGPNLKIFRVMSDLSQKPDGFLLGDIPFEASLVNDSNFVHLLSLESERDSNSDNRSGCTSGHVSVVPVDIGVFLTRSGDRERSNS